MIIMELLYFRNLKYKLNSIQELWKILFLGIYVENFIFRFICRNMKLFIINVYKMFNVILFIYIMKVDRGVFIL